MNNRQQWIEENRDALEKRYHEMYELTLKESLYGCWDAFVALEDALVKMGILEADDVIEAPDDVNDENDAINWYEWALDNKIDQMREEAMEEESNV